MELLDQLRTAYGRYPVTDAVCETGSLANEPCIRFSFPNAASADAATGKASSKELTLDEFAFFTEVTPNGELFVDHVRLENLARKTGPVFGPAKLEPVKNWVAESFLVSAVLSIQSVVNSAQANPGCLEALYDERKVAISKSVLAGGKRNEEFALFSLSFAIDEETAKGIFPVEATFPLVKSYVSNGSYDYVFIGYEEGDRTTLVIDLFALSREMTLGDFLAAYESFFASLSSNLELQPDAHEALLKQAAYLGIDVSDAAKGTTVFDGSFEVSSVPFCPGDAFHLQKLVHAIASLHLSGVTIDLFQSSETDNFMVFPNYISYLWYRFAHQLGQVEVGYCEVCGRGFSCLKGRGKPRKYCSEKCKTNAKNKRVKDERDLVRKLFLEQGLSVSEIVRQVYGKVGGDVSASRVQSCLRNYPAFKHKVDDDLKECKGAPFVRRCMDEGVLSAEQVAARIRELGIAPASKK